MSTEQIKWKTCPVLLSLKIGMDIDFIIIEEEQILWKRMFMIKSIK